MATVEERLTILEQEMAKLPTKDQIQQLSDLVRGYDSDATSKLALLADRVTVLETQVADLRTRVLALENA